MNERMGKLECNPEKRDDDDDTSRADRVLSQQDHERLAHERFEEIYQYFKDQYARREVVMQTRTPGGLLLDWVPIESQLGCDKLADPPEEDRPLLPDRSAIERREAYVSFELDREGAVRGPRGTVPMWRRDLERLCPMRTLQDYLSKHGRANIITRGPTGESIAFPEDGGTHKYANTSQSVTAYGTEGNVNAWDPYVEWSDEFSLGQLALARGSGSGFQTLEVGHQEYRDLYGDWVPHLFVFYTTNGYTSSGDNKGGYNQDVKGWVQYSSGIHPAALSSPLSQFGGTQYILSLKAQLWQGNWWVRVNGQWIGYYPASLYNSAGLRNQAGQVSWFGEIVDSSSHAGTTATDMGNGHWPYEGWQHCAYMNNLLYQSNTSGGMQRYSASASASHPKCYGVEEHFSNAGSWGSYFWWGGSGRNSQCP